MTSLSTTDPISNHFLRELIGAHRELIIRSTPYNKVLFPASLTLLYLSALMSMRSLRITCTWRCKLLLRVSEWCVVVAGHRDVFSMMLLSRWCVLLSRGRQYRLRRDLLWAIPSDLQKLSRLCDKTLITPGHLKQWKRRCHFSKLGSDWVRRVTALHSKNWVRIRVVKNQTEAAIRGVRWRCCRLDHSIGSATICQTEHSGARQADRYKNLLGDAWVIWTALVRSA